MNAIMWQPGVTLDQIERQVIERAFHYYNQNKAKTASALGISIRTLDTRLEDYAARNINGSNDTRTETRSADETSSATLKDTPDSSDQSSGRPSQSTQNTQPRLVPKQSAHVSEKQPVSMRKRG